MSREELENSMEEVLTRAFVRLGISETDPLEMQKDFAFIRRIRSGAETFWTQGIIAGAGLFISALVTVIVLGIKTYFGKK